MSNLITRVDVAVRRLDPVEAELIATVRCRQVTPSTLLKGQLTGPRCPYASTVEIAYPWREIARTQDEIQLRALIPEPSPWDTQSPFRYESVLDLLEDGVSCDKQVSSQGIRTVHFGPRGWRWNGRELSLHARRRDSLTEDSVLDLRTDGCNALLLPVEPVVSECLNDVRACAWRIADHYGFLLLGLLDASVPFEKVMQRARCTCALGWVATAKTFARARSLIDAGLILGFLLGQPDEPVPEGCSFVVVPDASWKTSVPQVWVP